MIKILLILVSLILILDSNFFKVVANGLFYAFIYTLASPVILYLIIVLIGGV